MDIILTDYSRYVSPNFQCLKSLLCGNLTTAMGNLVILSSRLAFRSSEYKILAFIEALYLNNLKQNDELKPFFFSVFVVPTFEKPLYLIP